MRHLAAIVLQDSLVTVTAGRRSRGTFLPMSWPGGNDAAKVTRVSRWPVRGVKEPVRYWVDAGRYRVLESCFGALQEARSNAQALPSQNLIRPRDHAAGYTRRGRIGHIRATGNTAPGSIRVARPEADRRWPLSARILRAGRLLRCHDEVRPEAASRPGIVWTPSAR
jgi:hypothetical protein